MQPIGEPAELLEVIRQLIEQAQEIPELRRLLLLKDRETQELRLERDQFKEDANLGWQGFGRLKDRVRSRLGEDVLNDLLRELDG